MDDDETFEINKCISKVEELSNEWKGSVEVKVKSCYLNGLCTELKKMCFVPKSENMNKSDWYYDVKSELHNNQKVVKVTIPYR